VVSPHSPEVSGGKPDWSEPQKLRVRTQLHKLLECRHLHSSKRCSHFLRFVIEQALENRLDSLKERTLGIAVFERDPNYDTNDDPVVRNTAGEVRKRLAQYYLEPGHEEEIRINLPTGSYVPEIRFPAERCEPPAHPSRGLRFPFRKTWMRLLVAAIVLTAATIYASVKWRRSDLDRFWDPVAQPPGQILICMGQPRAYGFTDGVQSRLEAWYEHGEKEAPPPRDLSEIPLQSVAPIWDRYIDLYDAQGYERLARHFYSKGKAVQLRGDRSVSLSELRGRPVILMGAFSNDWTLSLAGELRFYFQNDLPNRAQLVLDRQNPKNQWRLVNAWPDWKNIPVDYAIVTRVKNPTTEQTVVIAAGITHFGTKAAAEMLTNPTYFQEALRGSPKDWAHKNMQFVLSVRVISGAGGPPKVLATYFW
jgi:hypothetical protein